MSGHSKWSTIKHAKAVTDARRGKLFTKLTKEIILAARQGAGNIEGNFRLRMAVQKAKENNVPNDTIERAIKKASGSGESQDQMQEVVYEGYGPGGTAILLQTITDNRNRTVSDVRSTLTKDGGNLADAGAVAWQFEQMGVVVVEVDGDKADEITLDIIDAGADDFESVDETLRIYSSPSRMEQVRKIMANHGVLIKSSEIEMMPKNTVNLDKSTAAKILKLLDTLEEIDDVQKVFSNADFPDDILEQYRLES